MNYYHDWWEKARNQNPLILTKPKERELLLKRIKKLEEGIAGKSFKDLEIERNVYKSELEKSKEEVNNLTEFNNNLTEQINKKDEQIKKLASELIESEKDLLNIETHYRKELKDQATNQKKKVQTLKEELTNLQATLTKDQKDFHQELTEKDNQLKAQLANSRILAQQLKETKENYQLEKELAEKQLQTLTDNNTNLNNQVANLATQKATAKPAFEELETIIANNRALLFPIKKRLKVQTEEIKTAFNWDKTLEWDLGGGSTATLPTDDKDKELAKLQQKLTEKEKELIRKEAQWTRDKQEIEKKLRESKGVKEKEPIPKPTPIIPPKPTISKKPTSKETKWQHLHPHFTSQLIKEWEQRGFDYQKTQEWASVWGTKFNPQDYDFIAYLKNTKGSQALDILNTGDEATLRAEYNQWKETNK